MITKIISTRLTELSSTKIKRYFNMATTRQLIESIIRISEADNNLRQKIVDDIKQNSKKQNNPLLLLKNTI
jgi:hypothetical protein